MRAPRHVLRTGRRELWALLVLSGASAAACWPWWVPGRVVFGQRDTAFTVLASRHLQRALLGEHSWSQGPLGWPMPWSVTQADFTAGQGVLALPLETVGIEPFAAMNLVAFLGILLTAWCCHLLVQALLGPGPHSWVAGVAAACHPMHLAHAQHVNLIHHEWMVLGALLLGWGLNTRRPELAFVGGLALATAPWFGLYMGMHAAMVAVFLVLGAALARRGDGRSWLGVGLGLGLGVLAFAPVLATYARVGFLFDVFTDPGSLAAWSWDPATTLAPIQRAPLHQQLFALEVAAAKTANNPANPGYLAFSLALLGGLCWRALPGSRWAWSVIVAVALGAALLALGPVLVWNGQVTGIPGPYRLFDWIPGFYGLRDPVRWLGVSFTALGLVSGVGAWWLGRKLGRWGPIASALLGLVLVSLLVAERATPRGGNAGQLQLHPAYAELDRIQGIGPIWDDVLSLSMQERGCTCSPTSAYRAALYHGRPLVSGTAARGTEASRSLQRILRTWPSAASVELLRVVGTRAVLDHSGTTPSASENLACSHHQGHTLCELEPRAPLPDPGAVHDHGEGAVIGLRWAAGTPGPLEVRCGDEAQHGSSEVWQVVTTMRLGGDTPVLEFFLDQACEQAVEATPAGWTPLYVEPDASTWPPPWRDRGPGMGRASVDLPLPDRQTGGRGVRKHPKPDQGEPTGGRQQRDHLRKD